MDKSGILYREMKIARIKFLIVNIICTILYLLFVTSRFPYIRTQMTGPTELDTARFVSETKTETIDELITLGRKETKTLDTACYKDKTYWQDGRYYYKMQIDSIVDTGRGFTEAVPVSPSETEDVEMYRIYTAKLGGKNVAVLAPVEWTPSYTMEGYVTELSRPVLAKLSETLTEGEVLEVADYMLDIRGVEMEVERSDYALFWIFMIILVFLWAKLVIYFINPLKAPTYRQLAKYGIVSEVSEEINEQALSDSAYKEKGSLVLEEYILQRKTFVCKVYRNHMAKN